MNIENPKALRDCTSCGFCGAVCPTDAITISLNLEGFYRPTVNPEKCIDCSLCVKSCYKFDPEIKEGLTEKESLCAAAATDKKLLSQTSSGAIADLLAKSLIRERYKCIGVIYDSKNNIAIGKCAQTETEVDPFRGSKYIQSYSVEAFKELVKNCRQDRFAVFGLPCHIYAISQFLDSRNVRHNHLLIDLYCHGCPSMNVWSKYINEKVVDKEIHDVSFRSKKRGWGRFCVEYSSSEGKYFSPRFGDEFFSLFFSDLVLNSSCSDCKVRSSLHYCDIRLGDFWGKEYLSNTTGMSAVTICTEHGKKAFARIQTQIISEEKALSVFLPYQSFGKVYKVDPQKRQILLEMLQNPDLPLSSIVKKYNNMLSFKQKTGNFLKHLVRLMPLSVENFIKGLR